MSGDRQRTDTPKRYLVVLLVMQSIEDQESLGRASGSLTRRMTERLLVGVTPILHLSHTILKGSHKDRLRKSKSLGKDLSLGSILLPVNPENQKSFQLKQGVAMEARRTLLQ